MDRENEAPEGGSKFTRTVTAAAGKRKLVVDYDAREVTVDGQVCFVGKGCMLARVLELLTKKAGLVCTKRMLLDHLYRDRAYEAKFKILENFVFHMRAELKERLGTDLIGTAWGRGYYFGELRPEDASGCIEKKMRARFRGPDGSMLRVSSLKSPNLPNWKADPKAELVCAIEAGAITLADALTHYPGLTSQEIGEWRSAYGRHGMKGLAVPQLALVA